MTFLSVCPIEKFAGLILIEKKGKKLNVTFLSRKMKTHIAVKKSNEVHLYDRRQSLLCRNQSRAHGKPVVGTFTSKILKNNLFANLD